MSNPSDHSFFYDEKTGHYSQPRTEGQTSASELEEPINKARAALQKAKQGDK